LDRSARFWRGETAEQLVEQRTAQMARDKADRLAARASKRTHRRSIRTGERAERGAKTPEQTLARLKRALPRRKTLAARERLAQRIRSLEAALEEARR
jgi:hypothetical protein